MREITLQPIAIVIPNEHCIYSLSQLRQVKRMGYEEFYSEYIDQSYKVRVCLTNDRPALENSVVVKAYGFSYDGWFIVNEG